MIRVQPGDQRENWGRASGDSCRQVKTLRCVGKDLHTSAGPGGAERTFPGEAEKVTEFRRVGEHRVEGAGSPGAQGSEPQVQRTRRRSWLWPRGPAREASQGSRTRRAEWLRCHHVGGHAARWNKAGMTGKGGGLPGSEPPRAVRVRGSRRTAGERHPDKAPWRGQRGALARYTWAAAHTSAPPAE